VNNDETAEQRHIDPEIGMLSGEGSLQRITAPLVRTHTPGAPEWHNLPEPERDSPTYYDYPVIKAPVWKWYIPAYYYFGGTAGAALVIGAAAQLHAPALNPLIKRSQWVGTVGSAIGGLLLILDLGRPMRFLAMMRVFRPTSPMNMGVWILSGAAPFGTSAALFCGRTGWLGAFGKYMSYAAGFFGLALATYTGVLVGNSVIPVWYLARTVLPLLFGSSGLASAVSILDILSPDPASKRVLRITGTVGRVAELAAGVAMERAVAKVPRAAIPLRQGGTSVIWRGGALLTASSVVVSMLPGNGRWKQVTSGSLGALGSFCVRFAVHYAGIRSAKDPRASFEAQRAERRRSSAASATIEGDVLARATTRRPPGRRSPQPSTTASD
jgi:formate-dependent nitrite reductase membrane component NrfD